MSETKHTPGEWKIATHFNEPCTVYVEQDGNEPGICTTDGETFTPVDSEKEQIANARLIAAAPELLAALKDAQEELRLLRMKDTATVYNPGLNARISAAIAKAGTQ